MNITFMKGLIGLEDYKKYIIEEVEENKDFKILKSLDDKDFSLVITSPFNVDNNYQIELTDEIIDRLKIKSEKEVLVYTTVNLNSDIKKITTNFRAPIIINIENNLAEQIILNKEEYKIKQPLIKENN